MKDATVQEIKSLRRIKTVDFRHPDGRILPGLPAHQYEKYVARGLIPVTDPSEPRMDRISCPVCDNVVYGGRNLEAHIENHEGMKELLEKWKMGEINLKEFRTIVSELKEETPAETLECEICGKTFSHKIALAGHRKSHQKSNKEE